MINSALLIFIIILSIGGTSKAKAVEPRWPCLDKPYSHEAGNPYRYIQKNNRGKGICLFRAIQRAMLIHGNRYPSEAELSKSMFGTADILDADHLGMIKLISFAYLNSLGFSIFLISNNNELQSALSRGASVLLTIDQKNQSSQHALSLNVDPNSSNSELLLADSNHGIFSTRNHIEADELIDLLYKDRIQSGKSGAWSIEPPQSSIYILPQLTTSVFDSFLYRLYTIYHHKGYKNWFSQQFGNNLGLKHINSIGPRLFETMSIGGTFTIKRLPFNKKSAVMSDPYLDMVGRVAFDSNNQIYTLLQYWLMNHYQ